MKYDNCFVFRYCLNNQNYVYFYSVTEKDKANFMTKTHSFHCSTHQISVVNPFLSKDPSLEKEGERDEKKTFDLLG